MMNERIRELAEQAKNLMTDQVLYLSRVHNRTLSVDEGADIFEEKFAELIIQECAEICYRHSDAAGGVDTAFGYGYKDCGNDIKRHFGVE